MEIIVLPTVILEVSIFQNSLIEVIDISEVILEVSNSK